MNQNSYFWGGLFYKTFWLRPPYTCFFLFWTLGGLFWVWFLVFENFKIVFGIIILTFGGSVLWHIFIEASSYMFLIFWNFRGSFLSLIFGFWKFRNCILNQHFLFLGVCFIKLFDLRPPYICFWFFGTLGCLFLVHFFCFWGGVQLS